jgi:hypothetical protein
MKLERVDAARVSANAERDEAAARGGKVERTIARRPG